MRVVSSALSTVSPIACENSAASTWRGGGVHDVGIHIRNSGGRQGKSSVAGRSSGELRVAQMSRHPDQSKRREEFRHLGSESGGRGRGRRRVCGALKAHVGGLKRLKTGTKAGARLGRDIPAKREMSPGANGGGTYRSSVDTECGV
eukprot:8524672-Pyramimonas_sp.AAC.1